jgi:DNA-directed RNA polymerase specialized sigma24 family protein
MPETKQRPDYTTAGVRWILEHYLSLADGKTPTDGLAEPDYGCRIQRSRSLKAAFERPIQLKADIDRAIQCLKPTERAVVIAVCISGFNHYEVAYWWDKDTLEIRNIEDYAIRKIKRVLNKGFDQQKRPKSTTFRGNNKS